MNLQVEYEFCYWTFYSGIALTIPGVCTLLFSVIILATVAIKSNTYVRKELEDSQEGKMEDFDVDKD